MSGFPSRFSPQIHNQPSQQQEVTSKDSTEAADFHSEMSQSQVQVHKPQNSSPKVNGRPLQPAISSVSGRNLLRNVPQQNPSALLPASAAIISSKNENQPTGFNPTIQTIDIRDLTIRLHVKKLLESLDDVTMDHLFGKIRNIDDILDTEDPFADNIKLSYLNGFAVGLAGSSENFGYAPQTVYSTTIVVLPDYRGRGIGIALREAHATERKEQGYKYCVGGIDTSNEKQMNDVVSHGWRETWESINKPQKGIRCFWKAIDPAYSEIEPRED